ncbi:MAG: hypothetical protein SV201_04895 [Pseudomonadota bacterium]|nr:hypothetical protein [Pseudomonadota bacterium]
MPRRNWNRIQPTSIGHAMELCIDYAKEKDPTFSIDRLAEFLGQQNKWIVYKWIGEGRLPAILIRPFQTACGINFITRYLAHSDQHMLIKMPTGRKTTNKDINALNMVSHETIGLLMRFNDGAATADETITAITEVMESFAWHKGNVEKSAQPELDFIGDGETE